MAAVSPLVALSSALLEVVPKGPDLVPFAQSSTQADALFPPEALVVAASDRASDYTGAARAAAWTAESRRRPGRGPKALHEPELLAAIDQAKVDLMHWRSREAITDHINDSMDLTSLVTSIHTDPDDSGPSLWDPVESAGFLRRIARRDDLALAHLRSHERISSLDRGRATAMLEFSELRQDCQKLLKEIQDMNDAHILAAEREMSGRQLSAVEAYKARGKIALARREVARNVLQALVVESGFDWAADEVLKEVLLALGEASVIVDDPKEIGQATEGDGEAVYVPSKPAVLPEVQRHDPAPGPDDTSMDMSA